MSFEEALSALGLDQRSHRYVSMAQDRDELSWGLRPGMSCHGVSGLAACTNQIPKVLLRSDATHLPLFSIFPYLRNVKISIM